MNELLLRETNTKFHNLLERKNKNFVLLNSTQNKELLRNKHKHQLFIKNKKYTYAFPE